MKFKIAIIEWVDSTYYKLDYIDSVEDIPKIEPRTLVSCGFFVSEDKHSITISQDKVIDGKAERVVLSIPKVSVIRYSIKKINDKNFGKK